MYDNQMKIQPEVYMNIYIFILPCVIFKGLQRILVFYLALLMWFLTTSGEDII